MTDIFIVDNSPYFTKISLQRLTSFYEAQYRMAKAFGIVSNRFEFIYKLYHPHQVIKVPPQHARVFGEQVVEMFADALTHKAYACIRAFAVNVALHKLDYLVPQIVRMLFKDDIDAKEGQWFNLQFYNVFMGQDLDLYSELAELQAYAEPSKVIAELYVDPSLFGDKETARMILQAVINFSANTD